MPSLETSTIIILAALGLAVAVFMIFASPKLVPRLAQGLHHSDEEIRLSVVDRISLYISSVVMFFVAIIVACMVYEVVMRYFFGKPTLWVEELSRWLGGSIFLLAGIYAMQQRSHIRVVLLYDAVPRGVQRVFDLISTACVVAFCLAVISGYWKLAYTKFKTWELYGSAWNPPIPAVMKPLICITVALIALQAINNLFMDWSKPKAPPHNPAEDL
jgi:TRAP-type C4-dicarboxylate transport system permease small subunit